ncbi:MAG: tRNA (adenosine(37)-N6)-dimethylallyltransferase MiaA [Ignavibacteria bacterium]|nr:tRNA (adenosine(37)-N6)-dimethylallyltransferase MiaA [Ignavibacteria bacterium]
MDKRKVIVLMGPTASGKTEISISVALHFYMEIISADSRQIYKGFPIASAIPSEKERKGVVHHFMEELSLNEEFNAGEFGNQSRERIRQIFSKGKKPLVVGGSGLYLQSLIEGLFEEESKNKIIRANLNALLKEKGKEYLYDELKKVDPDTASKMSHHYHRRVIRALEVFYTTGKKISELQKEKIHNEFDFHIFGLMPDRDYLYERINSRVDYMIANGLIDEVKKLQSRGYHYQKYNSLNTVGVREIFDYLEGKINLEDAVELIKRNTRRYAKRQITWFRRDENIEWLDVHPDIIINGILISKIEKALS